MGADADYPDLAFLLDKFFDSAGTLKLGLKDGHLSRDEIVSSIPDEGARKAIQDLLTALDGLPAEISKMEKKGVWELMRVVPELIMSRVMKLFK